MCKFCEAVRANEDVDAVSRAWTEKFGYEYEITYSVVIERIGFLKRLADGKYAPASGSRSFQYERGDKGFALNYCPECGKKFGGDSND